ncbi:hypothetical protein K439DRAFT_1615661 [Ramaria rubella]|nr:hypothetical protein K439DRAFT_1615661 [Ramaria rubella]
MPICCCISSRTWCVCMIVCWLGRSARRYSAPRAKSSAKWIVDTRIYVVQEAFINKQSPAGIYKSCTGTVTLMAKYAPCSTPASNSKLVSYIATVSGITERDSEAHKIDWALKVAKEASLPKA